MVYLDQAMKAHGPPYPRSKGARC